jgi:predicted dehydrogenase
MNKKFFNVGIIGCGIIGQKRAEALNYIQRAKLVACADINLIKAEKIAKISGAKIFTEWRDLIKSIDIDLVIIATPHNLLAEICSEAINSRKHVLVEKPAGICASQLDPLILAAAKHGVKVRVGLNHRHHRSIRKAKELVDKGELGELMFIRGRYGHGGRIGYEKEWRANKGISGGGELIDQGPHLIDLSRWFLGEITEVNGFAHTYFWNMSVDDNSFMLLKTKKKQVAFLHVSCTEWKNLFSMEIYGKLGKLDISGLGGSYGLEKITWYKMLKEMGPPETVSWEFPMADNSWTIELLEFFNDIEFNKVVSPSLIDAQIILRIIEKVYK